MPKNRNVKPSVHRNVSRVKYLVSNQLLVSKANSASRKLISASSVSTTPSSSSSYIDCVLPEVLDRLTLDKEGVPAAGVIIDILSSIK
jgi:hypothetical protein